MCSKLGRTLTITRTAWAVAAGTACDAILSRQEMRTSQVSQLRGESIQSEFRLLEYRLPDITDVYC